MKITMLASGTVKSSLTYRILSFGRQLVKRGHDVTIVAPTTDKYSKFQPETFNEIDGVKIIRPFQPGRGAKIGLVPYIFSAACQLVFSPSDLIYLYKPTPLTIVGLLPKLLRRTPVVLDMDDLGSEVMRLERQSAINIKLVQWCEWAATRFATGIVTVSSYLQEYYQKKYPKKRVAWIPNGTDAHMLSQSSQKSDDGKIRIIMLGAIERSDIIEPLVHAFAHILRVLPQQSIELVVIGDGPCKAYFEQLVEELGIAQHVRFTGWQQKQNFALYMKQGDIGYCVMPDNVTTRACSNMKLFDYMALGVVPLVSDVGDLPAYSKNGAAGYCIPAGNQQALVDGLLFALRDDRRWQKARLAQELAEQQYDWSILSARLEMFYKELTS